MADDSGPFQGSSPINDVRNDDKEKEKKMNDLMERLRSRVGMMRSWSDTTKALKMSMNDKRHQSELFEKSLLQKHLETLQTAFRVMSLSLMLERLEMLSRQVTLKFHIGQPGTNVFLSSETFYVEVQLDNSGAIKDVRISHNGEPQSCRELTKILANGDFKEFQKHLEGLNSIYQINGDKKQRTKAYHALQALEDDLTKLAELQSSICGTSNYIHKSPLGILEPRSGGHPMKLTYFVHPYDLLDVKTKSSLPMTITAIQEHDAGHSLTLGICSSSSHKLQMMPLMMVKSVDGKTLPSFPALTHLNSSSLPATFVLRLHKPLPMSLSIIHKIRAITGCDFVDLSKVQPLMPLIVWQNTKGKKVQVIESSKGLHVCLPDQTHNYFLNVVSRNGDLQGVTVSTIMFTHPTKVAAVILHLRQQVLFNTLIASCVRHTNKAALNGFSPMTFEVTPLSLQHITVTFEHPIKECIATVTMRSILRTAMGDLDLAILNSPEPVVPPVSKVGLDRRLAYLDGQSGFPDFSLQSGTFSSHDILHEVVENARCSPELLDNVTTKVDKITNNPLLASLLDQGSSASEPASMLSALLGDQPQSVTVPKQRKPRKRRSVGGDQRSPGSMGKSPKRKVTEEDIHRELATTNSMEVDSQSVVEIKSVPSSCGVSPSSANTLLTGLVEENNYNIPESHVTKLESSLDNIIKQESKNLTGPHQSDPTGYNNVDSCRIKEEVIGKVEEARRVSKATSLAELLDSNGGIENKVFNNGPNPVAMPTANLIPGVVGGLSAAGGMTNMLNSGKISTDTKPPPTYVTKSLDRSKNFDIQERVAVKSEKNSVEGKAEERVKDKVKSERTRDKDEEHKPLEREKIKVKLNTSKLMKEPSRSNSPHGEKSTRDFSKSCKDSYKSYKEKVYDLTSDSEMSGSVSRPLVLDGGKVSSPSLKIKKIRNDDSKEKKRSRYKHDSESSTKRRREECKKEKSAKKRRAIVEGDYAERQGSGIERYTMDSCPTKIKITGLKMQIQSSKGSSSSSISPVKQSSNRGMAPLSASGLKSSSFKSEKLSSSSYQLSNKSSKSSSSVRNFNRSKSDPQALNYSKLDSKLIKTPTIKLKPVVLPGSSGTITVASTKSGNSNKMSDSFSKKPLPPKPRKGSLSAVIDKLKQQQTGSSLGSAFKRDGADLKFDRKDSNTPPPKKDPIADKNEMEAIRKAIIREGIKPSTPTKEIGAFKSNKSMRPSSLTIDSTKRSEPKTGTPTAPIPKLSQNLGNKVGGPTLNSSTSKLGHSHNTPLNKSSSNTSDNSKSSSNAKDAPLVIRSSGNEGSSRPKVGISSSTGGHGPPDTGGGNTASRLEKLESRKDESHSASSGSGGSMSALNSTSAGSGNAKEGSKDSSDRPRKAKVDDISERLQSRHFLDAVTIKFAGGAGSKDQERKAALKGAAESQKNSTISPGSGDKSRPNGVTSRTSADSSQGFINSNVNTNSYKTDNTALSREEIGATQEVVTVPSAVSTSTSKSLNDSCGGGGGGVKAGQVSNNVNAAVDGSGLSCQQNCMNSMCEGMCTSILPQGDSRHTMSMMSMANSENKENSGSHDEDRLFRAPTPKSNRLGLDLDMERHESRQRNDARSKPVLSPHSDVSSPEDSLVIDCPGTPRPTRSPGCKSDKPGSNTSTDTPINKSPASAILSKSPCSPSPRKQKVPAVPLSPAAKSPMVQHNSPAALQQHHSPVEIDDDLMDAALML